MRAKTRAKYHLAYRQHKYAKAHKRLKKIERQLDDAEYKYEEIIAEEMRQAMENANIAYKLARGVEL
jgi:hypothetical protein